MTGQLPLSFPKRRKLRHYFNTVGESKELSRVYEDVNKAQEERIYQFMRSHDRPEGWSSWELFKEKELAGIGEFSVKRALNVLMKADPQMVYQTGKLRKGGHGRSVLVWKVKS